MDRMIQEYQDWIAAEGLGDLELGSADEHVFDGRLTADQQKWLANFSRCWEESSL